MPGWQIARPELVTGWILAIFQVDSGRAGRYLPRPGKICSEVNGKTSNSGNVSQDPVLPARNTGWWLRSLAVSGSFQLMLLRCLLLTGVCLLLSGCSINKLVVNRLGDALAQGGSTF